jgi:hypothetical protein
MDAAPWIEIPMRWPACLKGIEAALTLAATFWRMALKAYCFSTASQRIRPSYKSQRARCQFFNKKLARVAFLVPCSRQEES